MRKFRLLSLASLLICCACQQKPRLSTPKPRAYPRVQYPVQEYTIAEMDYCSFHFKRSVAAEVVKKDKFFDESPVNECWFNLHYPELKSTLYFSYYPMTNKEERQKLEDDAYDMTYEHTIRANSISEKTVANQNRTARGVRFDITGQSATPTQFFLTDGENHFLRAALYFDAQVNRDSLDPIIDYLSKDIDTIISTLQWTDK